MLLRRVGTLLGGTVLVVATLVAFMTFDRHSHSASDTLRPFFITMAPIWLVAAWAARVVLRRSRHH
jgi:hypothetical protein